jgi:hypothetical protein
MYWPGLATYGFAAAEQCITAFPHPSASEDVIWDVYRRSVLPMALQALGWEALHASAISTSAGVVGFCAVAGTGKSTLAFGMRRLGYGQWSDDALVLRFGVDGVRAIPLPFEARLRPGAITLFGEDIPVQTRYRGNTHGQQQFTDPAPLHAICVLTRASEGTPSGWSRMSPADAFRALLIHAHVFDLFDANRRRLMVERFLDVAEFIPAFELRFAPEGRGLDALLRTVVDGLGLDSPALALTR